MVLCADGVGVAGMETGGERPWLSRSCMLSVGRLSGNLRAESWKDGSVSLG
jgi:hypothetical protein